MSAKANYFKLGLFIIVAVALGIAAVLILGAGRLFQRKFIIETYLDQSVQGVDIGSKVKYRGVPIGHIKRIGFTRNHYTSPDRTHQSQHSYVMLELEITSMPFAVDSEEDLKDHLPAEVRHGLRCRLTSQGVTGTSYLEIDYLEASRYPSLPIDWEPEHPYIPSAPSVFSKIVNSAEELFSSLDKIDFVKLAEDVERLITTLDKKVGELPFNRLGTNAVQLLSEVRASNQSLMRLLDGPEIPALLKDASGAVASLRRTAESPALTNSVAQLNRTLRRLDQLVAGKDDDLQLTLENLRILTDNLRDLTENAKRFPSQLFFGEPPKPSRNTP